MECAGRFLQGENLGKPTAADACRRADAGHWPQRALQCAAWLLLLVVAASPAGAQQPDWQRFAAVSAHTVLTGEDGPALRYAFTVGQDRRGRIWVGESNGALRLDGDLVQRYPGAEVPALGSGFTRVFHGLANGDVLLGTDREGVLRWELAHDRFVPVTLADGRRLRRISAIEPAGDGGAWVSGERGLYHFDARSGKLAEVYTIRPLRRQ